MLTLSDFIAPETAAWNACHAWTTNSTIYELLTRILFFGSDVFTINEIAQHSVSRAEEIASSRASLTTLVGKKFDKILRRYIELYFSKKLLSNRRYILGGNVHLLPDEPLNGALFLHQQNTLIPRWRRVALAFKNMNRNLKELKYEPDRHDAHFVPDRPDLLWGTGRTISLAKETLVLDSDVLVRQFMPMPTLAILYPVFRYLLLFFLIGRIFTFVTRSQGE